MKKIGFAQLISLLWPDHTDIQIHSMRDLHRDFSRSKFEWIQSCSTRISMGMIQEQIKAVLLILKCIQPFLGPTY